MLTGGRTRGVHLRRSISDDGPRSYQPDRLHPDVIARMERAGGPAGELFSDIMNFTLKTQFENYGLAGGPVHDATCIGYLINPDGIKTQEMYVEVDVNSGPCYGRTVCDELGVLGKPANTKVGITIDTDWFWGLVEECVRGYIKTH